VKVVIVDVEVDVDVVVVVVVVCAEANPRARKVSTKQTNMNGINFEPFISVNNITRNGDLQLSYKKRIFAIKRLV